jgi:hypothetical protein
MLPYDVIGGDLTYHTMRKSKLGKRRHSITRSTARLGQMSRLTTPSAKKECSTFDPVASERAAPR